MICESILMPIPYCLYYYSFVFKFWNWEVCLQCDSTIFNTAFDILCPLHFLVDFRIRFWISSEKPTGILIEIMLSLNQFGSIVILIILNILIQDCGMYLYLFRSLKKFKHYFIIFSVQVILLCNIYFLVSFFFSSEA